MFAFCFCFTVLNFDMRKINITKYKMICIDRGTTRETDKRGISEEKAYHLKNNY